jgi:hypothetical protein
MEGVPIGVGPPDQARQQHLFREVNTRLRGVAASNGSPPDQLEILCECGAVECVSTVQLMLLEYERIRRDDALFVVVPGHETDATTTTERNERYVVVTAPPSL